MESKDPFLLVWEDGFFGEAKAGAIYVFLLIFPLENCEKKQNVISTVAHGDDFCYNPECKVGLCFWFGVKEAVC